MQNSVRKAMPLAIACLLALSGAAFAGQNADVVVSLTSPAEVQGVGAGGTVQVALSASGMVGVKQFDVTLEVSPADAFDLTKTTFQNDPAFTISPGVEFPASNQVKSGAASFGAAVDGGKALGTFTLTTSSSFTASTTATITVVRVSLGPTSTDRDVFTTEQLNLEVTLNPPAPAPTVTSISPTTGSIAGGTVITITGTNFQSGATVSFGGNAGTAVTFTSATSLRATTPAGAEGAVNVVVTNPDGQTATLTGGYTYVGIIEPTLTATTPRDVSLDYSAVGTASAINSSAGEVTFSVRFTNNTGAVAANQSVSFAVTNNGSEQITILSSTAAAINVAAGASRTVTRTTNASGIASLILDAEGDKTAGTTSVAVAVSSTAPNSEGTSRALTASFSATWDVPVAAELASFAASVTIDDQILLQWSVASQSTNLGWEVFRSTDNRVFERISDLIAGDGTTDEFKSYSFTDENLPAADVLYYYLNQIDLDGSTSRSSVIEVQLSPTAVVERALPTANALRQNFPNPFNPETTIRFDLVSEAVVTLTIYDLAGQVVRTLISGQPMVAGTYNAMWDGLNGKGDKVASGVYLYRIDAGEFSAMKKMTLLQ